MSFVVDFPKQICERCGGEYSPTRRIQKYCSRICYYLSKKGEIRTRTGEYRDCILCGNKFYLYPSVLKSRGGKYCSHDCASRGNIGTKWTKEFRDKFVGYWKGKHLSDETKKKISETRLRNKIKNPSGKDSYNWKGGVTPINKRIRRRKKMRLWREEVFKRDNWTCQVCGNRSGEGNKVKLEAHHIKSFAYFPKLRHQITNGQTLCVPCHKKTGTWGFHGKFRIE